MRDIFEGAGEPLTQAGFDAGKVHLGGEAEALWSLMRVETKGFGFFVDRRPKILFERHVFRAQTGGRFDASNPDLSNKVAGGYSGGVAEYGRLKRAMLLDRRAALASASWGLGQIMGYNATAIGYASCEAMVTAFAAGEDAQLLGCARFIAAAPALAKAFRDRVWDRVAFYYNGPKYKENDYDTLLAQGYALFKAQGCPSVELRRAQAYLTYLGFDPHGIDGLVGSGTTNALAAFRRAYVQPVGGPALPPAGSAAADYNPCLAAMFAARAVAG